tara:strand:+ start:2259 stop:2435 length:177 start_codon:yes stop_codon:yes gene_type:complete
MKSRGLGDTVKKFTDWSGITSMVEYLEVITESDCGCDKRRKWLNKQFPYKLKQNNKNS